MSDSADDCAMRPSRAGGVLSAILMLALTTSACATGADDPGVTERSDTSLPSLPGGGLRSLKPSAPAAIAQELSGVLGFDDIEGGCAYLETDDGTRHQVIYPEGWELQRSPVQLVSPEGQIVARLGDTVTVRGMAAADMASICQIGPMFRATAVELP